MTIDYKNTINLPQTDFAMKADLAKREPAMLAEWEKSDALRARSRSARRSARARVRPARRPAVREWRDPSRPRGQQDPQGHRRQVQADGGLPLAVRAGLGLPRPADRGRGREEGRQGRREGRRGRVPQAVPRIRGEADRPAAHGFQAPRRARRVGKSVPHDGFQVRSRHDPRAGEDRTRAATSCAASSRCTGASIAARRWPKPRSNIRTRPRRRSMWPTTRSIRRRWRRSSASTIGDGDIVAVPIWTTTPWTLPASLAVTLGAELDYVLVEGPPRDGKRVLLVLAEALLEKALQSLWRGKCRNPRPRTRARRLELLKLQPSVLRPRSADHPRRPRIRRRRHRRRAHRAGPWRRGLRRRPEIRISSIPVESIRSAATASICRTRRSSPASIIWKANDTIIELLRERGVLLAPEKITHSYPHCWRHRTPVVFRATPQWFIGMETGRAARAARSRRSTTTSTWYPAWGEERIAGMIEGRPDWCISRQRTWGVPIALVCAQIHK